jgi:hypothetical protein
MPKREPSNQEKPSLNWIERLTGHRREGDETRWHVHFSNRNEDGGPWWLEGQWMFHPTVKGYYLGVMAKGWWVLGTATLDWAELGLALGGEDSMFQFDVMVPKVFAWHFGVHVPRKLVDRVVYERRTLAIKPGYIGSLLWADVLYDETAKDMRDYYAKLKDPDGGECAHCGLPGYCHAFEPESGPETGAYEFRYFDDDYLEPTHSRVAIGTHERALGELEKLQAKGYRVRLFARDWPDEANCWSAIGTDLPHVVDCPGWEKKPHHQPSRASLWPGWQVRVRLRLRDLVLGKTEYTSKDITQQAERRQGVRYMKVGDEMVLGVSAVVPMPEGNYPCVVTFSEDSWKRKRLPWPSKVMRRAEVRMLVAIPFPGKGENSWDIDDDALYGLSAAGRSVAEVTAKASASVLRSRERHASRDWTPARGWPIGVRR